MTDEAGTESTAKPGWVRWATLAVGVIAIALVARMLGDQLPRLFDWVEGLGVWGPIAFIALYVMSTVFVIPGALVTLAGGALFGVVAGTAWVFIGAVLGSGAAFLIGRHFARSAVEDRIAKFERFAAIDRAVERDGLKMVLLLRLSPVFPFSLLNYALGLTAVRFRDYMLASIGMLPATVLYVYYGKLAGDLAQLASGVPQDRGPAEWALMGLGLLSTLGVTLVVTRMARRALEEIEEPETDPTQDRPEEDSHATR